MGVSSNIVKSLVKFSYQETQPASDLRDDGIMLHACDLLTTGLFWLLLMPYVRGMRESAVLLEVFVGYIFLKQKKNFTKEAVILAATS